LDQKTDDIGDLPVDPELWQVPYLINYVGTETTQRKFPPTQHTTRRQRRHHQYAALSLTIGKKTSAWHPCARKFQAPV
ncbi:MAG: hypothetical protein AAEC10_05925, partial [Rhodospirillales bacterium]